MASDYRKVLERTARQMIHVRRADVLVKLVLRTIVRTIKVKHAGIFFYEKNRNAYVVKVSKGDSGIKVPSGFTKVKKDNPLIRYFTDKKIPFPKDILHENMVNDLLQQDTVDENTKNFLEELRKNLSFYRMRICVPALFRNELIGLLFLGEKTDGADFCEEETGFLSVLASDVVMAVKNAWLIEDVSRQLEKNKRLLLQTVLALARAIEAKDQYTRGHIERVVQHSLVIAHNLRKRKQIDNWDKFVEDLRVTALLHDIGKIGVPEHILNKPLPLTEEERKVIEQHPVIGSNILSHIEEMKDILLGVRHHHERYDGKGYPAGLKGDQIPLIAAIVALADTFDAMTTNRSYRLGFPVQDAVKEIEKNSGKQFDPIVVEAFLQAYKSET